jgi:mannose-6-phosphate isomerase-like protein (cupin superfamily)
MCFFSHLEKTMGKFDQIEIQGEERRQALDKIAAQMDAWGLRMPDALPIPLHFGLYQFYQIGETEFWIANEGEAGYCGKFLFLFDGQVCPFHSHKVKHETFFIVKGTIRMITDEGERLMHAGDRLVMPPGAGHSFSGVGPALVLEVSMPSITQDSFFNDTRIGDGGVI